MKRIILSLVLMLSSTTLINAQRIFVGKENQHSIYGGENGKTYSAIISADFKSKQEALSKTVEFLSEFDFVEDKESILASVKEYDESHVEFNIPEVVFRFGWHGTAPLAGAVAPVAPVYIVSDLFFQFYDNGKIRVTIKNLSDIAFWEYAALSKKYSKEIDPEKILSPTEYDKYMSYMLAPTMQDGLGKATAAILVFANKGIGEVSKIQSSLKEFLDNIDEQIEIANKLEDKDFYLLGKPEELLENYNKLIDENDLNVPAATIKALEKEIAEGKVTSLYNYFWQRDVKVEFDNVFLAICEAFNGKIEGIADNGEPTWELVGDKLLPKDSKLRTKLQKAGLDYFSYYGDDK